METTKIEVEITEHRHWTMESVRQVCIENGLYTRGNNAEYGRMLGMVESSYPSNETIHEVAKDILEHSKEQTITNIMFLLINKAVTTFLEVKEPEEKI